MTIIPIQPNTAAAASAAANTSTGIIGGDQFMQLLLAQMKNQNPLDPVQDKDFMAQITQINSLMQMQKVSANMQSLTHSNQMIQAAGLIGKDVSYAAADGTTHSGVVSSVSYHGSDITLMVGSLQVPLANITGVQLDAGLQAASNG